jgi:hypothetical protein
MATLCLSSNIWASVEEYVSRGGDLYVGMLHKLAQNVHLQPLLVDQVSAQQATVPLVGTAAALSNCFEWLCSEFRPRQAHELFDLVHCLHTSNAHVRTSVSKFFDRCLPFLGSTKGALLCNAYAHKLLNPGFVYADEVERTLRIFEPEHQQSSSLPGWSQQRQG